MKETNERDCERRGEMYDRQAELEELAADLYEEWRYSHVVASNVDEAMDELVVQVRRAATLATTSDSDGDFVLQMVMEHVACGEAGVYGDAARRFLGR